MPLTLIEPPEAALALARKYVALLLDDAEALDIVPPYPIYTFPIEAVFDGRPLSESRLTAWQYLVVRGESPVAVAEVAVRTASGAESLQFATLLPRQYAESLASTIVAVEALPAVAQQEYALRILRGPSVSMLAVWLAGDADAVIPVDSSDAPLVQMSRNADATPTDEAALARRLLPLAQQRSRSSGP